MEPQVIQAAKEYAQQHGTSVSGMVQDYISLITSSEDNSQPLPIKTGPLTSSLKGSIKRLEESDQHVSGKELVHNAKAERFG